MSTIAFSRFSVKSLLKTTGTQAKPALGQNFLTSSAVSQKIIEAAQIKSNDVILEIGPGLGALTLPLAQKAKKVIAVEKDRCLAKILSDTLQAKNIKNVQVVNDDILNFQFSMVRLCSPPPVFNFQTIFNYQFPNYKIVANLPYNIATAVIMKFLETKSPLPFALTKPELMVVMVQKEVGQRLCALPPKTNKLAVFCQLYSQPKIISYVAKDCFEPRPKVDGAILKIIPNKKVPSAKILKLFSKIVRAGFSQPRKQLANNLSRCLELARPAVADWLNKNNIAPSQRAEQLTVDDWLKLTATL